MPLLGKCKADASMEEGGDESGLRYSQTGQICAKPKMTPACQGTKRRNTSTRQLHGHDRLLPHNGASANESTIEYAEVRSRW